MSETRDGGPAFPDNRWQDGMSLRDWFAGMALQGILAHQADWEGMEEWAYERADRMLAAREAR